jgi:hypothetical protein
VKINKGGPDNGQPGPSGLQNVTGIEIQADTDTIAWGAVGPFDQEPGFSFNYQNPGGGPVPYPTPPAVSDPRPMRAQIARFKVFATVQGGGSPIEVPGDDPGFRYGVEPGVPVNLNTRDRFIMPAPETPPGEIALRVSWGDVSAARKFQVLVGGGAEVVAE